MWWRESGQRCLGVIDEFLKAGEGQDMAPKVVKSQEVSFAVIITTSEEASGRLGGRIWLDKSTWKSLKRSTYDQKMIYD